MYIHEYFRLVLCWEVCPLSEVSVYIHEYFRLVLYREVVLFQR